MASSPRPTLGATRARQGRFGGGLMWVLVFGLILAVIGVFAAWAWKSGDLASTEPNNATRPSAVRGFSSPRPDAATRQTYRKGAPLAPHNDAPAPTGPAQPPS